MPCSMPKNHGHAFRFFQKFIKIIQYWIQIFQKSITLVIQNYNFSPIYKNKNIVYYSNMMNEKIKPKKFSS